MAIREATEADVDALLPLLRGYTDFYESDPTDEGLQSMARDVIAAAEDHAFLLVATGDGDKVVGFALNQWKWSSLRGARVVVMDDLFVAESARGQGHADALIEAVAEVARRHGARGPELVHDARQQARAHRLRPGRRHGRDAARVRARALVPAGGVSRRRRARGRRRSPRPGSR